MDDLKDIIPVILAGGQGKRLRPLTTVQKPKPFLRVFRPRTLLQETVLRVNMMQPPVILSAAPLREKIIHDMAAINIRPQQIFLEPESRNTAPAIAAAAHYFAATKKDPLLLVMPSDHAIQEPDKLLEAVQKGAPFARERKIVLFGIKPSRAETSYGYIERGIETVPGVFDVSRFTEKPDAAAAKKFLNAGHYSWNSGIFLFSTSAFLAQISQINPGLYQNSQAAVVRALRLQNAVFLEKAAFNACPAESIDRAVMEKAGNLVMIPVDMEWRDLGRWPDLIRHVLHRS